MKFYSPIIIFFASLFLAGCSQDEVLRSLHYDYLFAGHCYIFKDSANRIDQRIPGLGLENYDQVFLGGDVLFEGARDIESLDALDASVNLSSPNTHWALGNHDTYGGHIDWIEEYTGRKTFYTHHQNGITYLIINTNLKKPNCIDLDAQYQLIQDVCDTIQNSSHLVMVMHHIVWGKVIPDVNTLQVANGDNPWFPFHCGQSPHSFDLTVYPLLKKVHRRGVEVICFSGDVGQQKQDFEYITNDSIIFLAAGLNKTATDWFGGTYKGTDKVMVMHHDLLERKLSWEFLQLDSI